LSLLRKLKLKS